ncbi:MAG: DUF4350 domain-containing protein, partial [Gemmatimonadales bacterium]
PRVRIDEGHFNHWSTKPANEGQAVLGRTYAGLAAVLRNDGYVVTADTTRFTPETLRPYDILIVAGAEPVPDSAWNRRTWEGETFTRQELDALESWVRGGGSLLLAVNHAPSAWFSRHLASRFGVDMVNSYTADPMLSEYPDSTIVRGRGGATLRGQWLTYTRQNGMLTDHPITAGREGRERINRVRAGGGSSVLGPAGSKAFLALQPTAIEWVYYLLPAAPDAVEVPRSAAGRAQGIAFRFGAGRVVVVSTPHLFFESYMAQPGHDNRQLALNVAHWLSGLLPEPR